VSNLPLSPLTLEGLYDLGTAAIHDLGCWAWSLGNYVIRTGETALGDYDHQRLIELTNWRGLIAEAVDVRRAHLGPRG
jgi:hypothetical protein